VSVSEADLVAATRRLRQQPLDHGAWLEVAALLAALGHADDAELAFAAIGEGARVGGQVALAVACARHLAQTGSLRGPELVDRIVEAYAAPAAAAGEAAGARARRPSEAPPPGAARGAPVLAEDGGAPMPLEDARAVVGALGAWLAGREVPRVPPAPLLSALPGPAARALIGVMTARAVPAGGVIIEIGAPASSLFWLAHGTVVVSRDAPTPAVLGELHAGAFFGEIALVGGTRRTARVAAAGDAWLLEIPARAIEAAAQKHPGLAEVLARHARARLLANLVRTSELFRALADDDRDALLAKLETQLVPAGTTFIREGQPNDHLWVVVSGRCEVRAAGSSISELGPGAAAGEISLVSGAPAVADVVALEPAVLLRLSRRDFDVVARRHPALLAEVEKLVVARETANRALFQDASDLIV
jgi:CRP-like cAMP-binding protein